MVIDGQELYDVLSRTEKQIELRNEHGRCLRILTKDQALALDLDLLVGIGNRRPRGVGDRPRHSSVRCLSRQWRAEDACHTNTECQPEGRDVPKT